MDDIEHDRIIGSWAVKACRDKQIFFYKWLIEWYRKYFLNRRLSKYDSRVDYELKMFLSMRSDIEVVLAQIMTLL